MAKKKKAQKQSFAEVMGLKMLQNDLFNFIFGIALFVCSVWLVVAFASYFGTAAADQSLVAELRPGDLLSKNAAFQNACGPLGALLSDYFICQCFGYSAFAIPLFLCLVGLKLVKAYSPNLVKTFLCLAVVMLWVSVFSAKFLEPLIGGEVYSPGGGHGEFCSQWLESVVGVPGLVAILVIVAIAYLTYLSSETVNVVRKVLNPVSMIQNRVGFYVTNVKEEDGTPADRAAAPAAGSGEGGSGEDTAAGYHENVTQTVDFTDSASPVVNLVPNGGAGEEEPQPSVAAPQQPSRQKEGADPSFTIRPAAGDTKTAASDVVAPAQPSLDTPINPKEPWLNYKYPTLSLLKKYDDDDQPYIDMKEQTANKNRIVEVLSSFGVQIKTISATVGPTITLYEITPAEGVKISRIRNLEDDIALSLKAIGVRIIAPIPGKGTIGIEVPNAKMNIVSMESILNSEKFQKTTYELPIALGKTITNEVFMVDLAKIPHLLVAGATGQGKSVGLNAIITSLLYKKHPNELKLVLIDPKKVEFSVYASIANHFMAKVPDDDEPIITDVKKVVRTLNSLCKLMDTRYDLLKMAGARNIKEYNRKYLNHQLRLTDGHEFMPYIVVVIDEFGDLIMQVGREVELPIARIAQLARAVGIHMVIATQRPTTSIITGNIKANFPGRMAFKVSQMIDSRTILDRPGANQLIGRGDMLFLSGNEPVRVQCAFVDTPEVERINEYISQQPGPKEPLELPEPATDEGGDGSGGGSIDNHSLDPLFEEAAHAIVITQQGSTSMIQRRFSIGYNRAGRLMDQLEKAGIVGAAQGSKPREVLLADENSLENLLAALRG